MVRSVCILFLIAGCGRYGFEPSGTTDADSAQSDASAPVGPATAVASGIYASCAIVGGEVWCWGLRVGQRFGPQQVGVTTPERALSNANGPYQHLIVPQFGFFSQQFDVCAINQRAELFCSTPRGETQLGIGTQWVGSLSLIEVHVFLAVDGSVWQSDGDGQLGLVPDAQGIVGAAYSEGAICTLTDTTLRCRFHGDKKYVLLAGSWQQLLPGLGKVCALDSQGVLACLTDRDMVPVPGRWKSGSVTLSSVCAIDFADQLACWGFSKRGELGTPPETLVNVASPMRFGGTWTGVTQSFATTCGVANGAVVCAGGGEFGGIGDSPTRWRDTAVVAGEYSSVVESFGHRCATATTGVVRCWGTAFGDDDLFGLGPTPTLVPTNQPQNWNKVGLSDQHACGLLGTSLSCWGNNDLRAVGSLTNGVLPPTVVPGSWSDVAVAEGLSCARNNDRLFCWGSNPGRGLGDVGAAATATPTEVRDSLGRQLRPQHFDVHRDRGIAVDVSGRLLTWGLIPVATGGTIYRVPTAVGAETDWMSGSAGEHGFCAIKTDGSLWCWGSIDGPSGQPIAEFSAMPVRVGAASDWVSVSVAKAGGHACGQRSNGSAWCWGAPFQLGLLQDSWSTVPTQIFASRRFKQMSSNYSLCLIDLQDRLEASGRTPGVAASGPATSWA